MDIVPRTQKDWEKLVNTTTAGAGTLVDLLCTVPICQFLLGLASEHRINDQLDELRTMSEDQKKEISTKISKDYINSREFMIFYSNALEEFKKIKNIEKIQYFRSAVINGMIRRDVEENKKLLFIDALSNLPFDAVFLLKQIHDIGLGREEGRHNFVEIMKITGRDEFLLAAELKALERYHLLDIDRPSGGSNRTFDLIIYGKFGKEFISFITNY